MYASQIMNRDLARHAIVNRSKARMKSCQKMRGCVQGVVVEKGFVLEVVWGKT